MATTLTTPLDISKAANTVAHIMKQGLVPMLYGAPGFGKSSIAQEVADTYNLLLIDLRLAGMEPVDMNGVLGFNEDKSKGKYIPLDEIPLEGDPIPVNPKTGKQYAGFLVLLDELTSAADDTKAASYKFILDKKVGQKHVHKRMWIMAAGNREDDGAIASSLGTALGSRVVNLTIKENLKYWLKLFTATLDPRIVAFLNYEPDAFNKFNPDANEYTHACARTWSMLSKLITPLESIEGWEPMIDGTVGVATGRSFRTFITYFSKVVTMDQILKDPEGAHIPTNEPSWMYALTGVLARGVAEDNIAKAMTFIERMPASYQVISMRSIIARNPKLGSNVEVSNWCTRHADELF